MPKVVLALDVSLVSTAWAVGPVGGAPLVGHHRFAPVGTIDDEVWFAAMKWMNDMLAVHNPDVIAIEAAIMASNLTDEDGKPKTNPKTQGLLWGLQAVLRTVVKAKRPGVAKLIHASSARKLFTGRGNYSKGQAKPIVKRRAIELGWIDPITGTHDEADACCVWAKACADIDPTVAAQLTPIFSPPVAPKRVPNMEF